MPLDPSISLQAQPVQIQPLDLTKTLLSVQQIKYLMAEQERAQAQAALTRTQGAEAQATYAGRQRVRDVAAGVPGWLGGQDSPPLVPQTPGMPSPQQMPSPPSPQPGMPSGGMGGPGTPQPGAGASPQALGVSGAGAPGAAPSGGAHSAMQPRGDTLSLAQRLIAADPFEGREAAKNLLDLERQGLENQGKHFELTKGRLALVTQYLGGVTDQASLDLGLDLITHNGGNTAGIPRVFTPQLPAALAEMTRTAQQRVEEGQKATELKIAQQRVDTERFLAGTGRIEATKPIPAGPGFLQHPDAPPYRQVGPSTSGSQAPRSPQGQAQYNELSSEFNAHSQVFGEATAAYNKMASLYKDHTNTSDVAFVRGFNKLTEPGQAIGVFAGKQAEALGNLREQLSGELTRLLTDKGAVLDGTLRDKMYTTAKKVHALQIDQHLQVRDEVRQKATANGLPPTEVAPNRLTTYGSGGTAITQARFAEMLKDARVKGKTRGEFLLDLADKGFYVRGGPE